ncbi:hypothetical protein MLD38_032655 [Melastoma candidum]|uniref:Uncharacterized protein n=1 Tax=Melastoma candidum TaxID=119954 RepID=A0ACB9M415_9MYRT|nr:hypothetical protein MLD38_032655 [Melastoma candidum]
MMLNRTTSRASFFTRLPSPRSPTLPTHPSVIVSRNARVQVRAGGFAAGPSLDVLHQFDEIPDLDVVRASALLSRHARSQRHEEVILLFSRLLGTNVRPNEFTFGTVISSSLAIKDVAVGRQLHGCTKKLGLSSNVFVGSALVDFYVKQSGVEEARRAFDETVGPNVVSYTTLVFGYLKRDRVTDAVAVFESMPERNVVSWNAMIAGCSQAGHNEEAVDLFVQMLRDGFLPNQSTFPSVITAASNIATLGMGRSIHGFAIKCLGKLQVFVGNALISFYAKCGSMDDSSLMFNKLVERNIVSWNSLICGFAQNGMAEESIGNFERMKLSGIKPNSVSFLGLLWACNHAGLVDLGYSYFNLGRQEDPSLMKPKHYACMVDLLSRCGRFSEAEKFLKALPFDPGIGFWKALLGGCQIHSNYELGELAARKIVALDPDDVSSYVMLSNAYSSAGRWQSVSILRKEMKEKGLVRVPGCSWIEIKGKMHVLVNGDVNQGQKDDIYMVLGLIYEHLKEIRSSSALSECLLVQNHGHF